MPKVVTMATIAIATSPAMNAYSIAVTPELVASKFLNRYEHFAAELTSPKLRSAVRHSGGGHIASEICSEVGGQRWTPPGVT